MYRRGGGRRSGSPSSSGARAPRRRPGGYFVEESLEIIPGYPGAPYALALSARSNVYSEFDGGPGQIAFHGIFGIGGTPGTAASHGCVRVDSADMAWLGTHVKPGVPVHIVS